ncbi:glycosyltransferase family 4 protein [Candidatus Microgenomates bacterium]|nr:glycosyltransferase family 4 protein [Candidatus Microgenomates bacterium]
MQKKNSYTIGIDARIYSTSTGGIGRYTRELICGLESIIDAKDRAQNPYNKDLNFVIFLNSEGYREYRPKNEHFKKVLVDVGWYGFSEQFFTLPKWLEARLDLMHFTHFNKSIFYRKPYVVTIHDLTYSMQKKLRISKLPPIIFEIKHFVYEQAIKDTIRRAKAIVVPTKYSKKDIIKKYNIKSDTVAVTYESVDKDFAKLGSKRILENLKKRFNIHYPYFIYIGNAAPHKNLKRLVVAFSLFLQKQPEAQLVLIGKKNKFYIDLEEFVREKGLSDKVILTDMLNDAEYQSLLSGACASAFASLAEGFGIPPLEAMASNVPVVMSDATCLPEVGGDAALYFDPMDERDMAQKLEKIFTDVGLREQLIRKGEERIKNFSWDKMAQETLAVYEKILSDINK